MTVYIIVQSMGGAALLTVHTRMSPIGSPCILCRKAAFTPLALLLCAL